MKLTDRKRQDIINAAIEVFHEQGFGNAKMDQIAEVAQVSKRTVYNHFASKDELFTEIVEALFELFNKGKAFQPNTDWNLEQQLMEIAKLQMNLYCDSQLTRLTKIVMAATLNNDVDVSQIQQRLQNKEEDQFKSWLTSQISSGQLKDQNPDDMMEIFHGLLKSKVFWPQVVQQSASLPKDERDQYAKRVVSLFLNEFGA